MKPRAILFDLDGTLLDTSADLILTMNYMRTEQGLTPLPADTLRPAISFGVRAMLKYALDLDEHHADFPAMREKFLSFYETHLADNTVFFPQMHHVLSHLERNDIPWGIVTNKLTRHTLALLKALQLDHRPACIICGDTLPAPKPDPRPILHACDLLNIQTSDTLYIGDAKTDVLASKAAGVKVLVALYGYLSHTDDPHAWDADGYIQKPDDILTWI